MKLLHYVEAGIFFQLEDAFYLFIHDIEPGELEIGEELPLSCMFTIRRVMREGQQVGLQFVTQFYVKHEGGFILTYMKSGAGHANASPEVLLKIEKFVVIYNYPNKGTLAISPVVGPQIQCILEEQ